MTTSLPSALLDITDLHVVFPHRFGDFTAVEDLSLQIRRGEILGLIGESGAGKSTVGNAVIRLLEKPGYAAAGTIKLDGTDLSRLSEKDFAPLRGRRIGMIFQDPMTSLNPLLTIGDQLAETLQQSLGLGTRAAQEEAEKRLVDVGIPETAHRMKQYPHEFSGGMRQRVVIALALAGDPDLLIADEPTTALDVSIQKQVLDLIRRLCIERQLGVLLVTHDMGVIAETTDRVCVMRHGRLVEEGATAHVLSQPKQAYTRQLIASIPRIDRREARFHAPNADPAAIDRWLLDGQKSDLSGPFVETSALTRDFAFKKALWPKKPKLLRAVDTIPFAIQRGEVLGLVGESGSGKSTLGRLITGLLPISSGTVAYRDHGALADLTSVAARKRFRRDVQVVFQDPYSSLNGRMTVADTLAEPIAFHRLAPPAEIAGLVGDLLERVGLARDAGRKYPHQFSGGQRQRVCIARALSMRPSFLFCDEPTSALDVSIQAEMLALLMELKSILGLTMLFVSHDLAVIRQVSDRVAVMKAGRIVELKSSEDLFENPEDDYTKMLLQTAPRLAHPAANQPEKD